MKQKKNIVDPELSSKIQSLTKLSVEQRKKLINWFNKQNLEIQLLIFDEQRNQFFKLKNDGVDKSLISFTSFLLAIKEFYDKEHQLKLKNKSQTLYKLGNISKIESIKLKKEKYNAKSEKLLSYQSVIKKLHDDSFSLRDIQDHLLKRYRFKVSHTLISKHIKEHIGY